MTETQLAVFKGKKIRRHWDEENEKWYFSIVDIVDVLTGSPNPRSYWKVLKHRLNKEGSEVVTKCNHLKMQAADGKFYLTDCKVISKNNHLTMRESRKKLERKK